MPKKMVKTEKILDVSIALLKSEGDFAVTMRRVASLSEMSLSNVQYYFKNKDELLKAMADRYFKQCLVEIKQCPEVTSSDELRALVASFLAHGHEMSDMCRIFREYWAIATRNESIDDYLSDYYQELFVTMEEKFKPLARDENSLSNAVAILIPYVEGYSITAKSLPQRLDAMTGILCKILEDYLSGNR